MSNDEKDRSEQTQLDAEIMAVNQAVSQALGRLDLEAALSYFADGQDMIKISNGHVMRGKEQLRDYWQGRLGRVKSLRVVLENVEIHALDEHHAWMTADEFISADGNTQKAIVSSIFVRTGPGWKILLDHTTYLP